MGMKERNSIASPDFCHGVSCSWRLTVNRSQRKCGSKNDDFPESAYSSLDVTPAMMFVPSMQPDRVRRDGTSPIQ